MQSINIDSAKEFTCVLSMVTFVGDQSCKKFIAAIHHIDSKELHLSRQMYRLTSTLKSGC